MWLISASCKTALVSARGVVLVKYKVRSKGRQTVEKKMCRGEGEVVVFTMYFLGLTFFFFFHLVVNSFKVIVEISTYLVVEPGRACCSRKLLGIDLVWCKKLFLLETRVCDFCFLFFFIFFLTYSRTYQLL